MLTDAIAWRVKEKTLPKPVTATDWNLVALLVGRGSGLMPANDEQAKAGKGVRMTTTTRLELLADKSALLGETVWLIREYYCAMTEGKISLHLSVLQLPNVCFELTPPGGSGKLDRDLAKLLSAIHHPLRMRYHDDVERLHESLTSSNSPLIRVILPLIGTL